MNLEDYLISKDWEIVDNQLIPPQDAVYYSTEDLNLSVYSNSVLSSLNNRVYRHQKNAIQLFLQGENISLSTSTSSGKSLIFYICGIENLLNGNNKILAIYPLKALGTEQLGRWNKAFKDAGLNFSAARIDGGVPTHSRLEILKNNDVLIMTPDIIHAWLLYNLNSNVVKKFLSQIKTVIIDESHNYSGVFGSNSAFLFRRLNHIISHFGEHPQYISASATIKNPAQHLNKLTGLNFKIIDETFDTSPKNEREILLVNPPQKTDILTSFSELMRFISENTEHRFISFVDSRKQTEYLASIASRQSDKGDIKEEDINIDYDYFENLKIFPYRSGYEEDDRIRIQDKLTKGELRGVISTAALEMGIDIPYLTLGVLFGVPNSATSFYQRIGRIGRHAKGKLLIINNGSIHTESVFREPEKLLSIPLSESALYLENPRIQYIHALCLARQGGEDEMLSNFNGDSQDKFETEIDFPQNFIKLCESERIGELTSEFQTMKSQAGEDPNHTFPLRDIDVQYKIEMKKGPERRNLGSLSFSQVLREAYPGAVYYYQTQSFRIYKVNLQRHFIEARREKKYTTKPTVIPSLIFPNLSNDNAYGSIRFGDLIIIECNLQIRESIIGYKERRGPNEIQINYPLNSSNGLYFDQNRFTRNYFTTGIIVNHPILNSSEIRLNSLSEILFESFIMTIPFERQDVSYGSDKHRTQREFFNEGDKFLSIYDKTYGSLRLTSRLLDYEIISSVLDNAVEIAANEKRYELNKESIEAIKVIQKSLNNEMTEITLDNSEEVIPDDYEKVILPGSVGLNTKRNNEEFKVEGVFFSRDLKVLSYLGKHLSQQTEKFNNSKITIPVSHLIEIPGESKTGYYNYATGQTTEEIEE